MSPGVILAIAAGLAMDAFAVSLAAGATGMASAPRPIFRLSFHFGLFQFFMPVLGWYVGSRVAHLITGVDHWIAFGLLAFVGMRMIRSGRRGEDTTHRSDPSRGLTLIMLSLATSIDAARRRYNGFIYAHVGNVFGGFGTGGGGAALRFGTGDCARVCVDVDMTRAVYIFRSFSATCSACSKTRASSGAR